jgi:hypothetical protein
MEERKPRLIDLAEPFIDPCTWATGIACLAAGGFVRDASLGLWILGGLLLLTPVAPKLLHRLTRIPPRVERSED